VSKQQNIQELVVFQRLSIVESKEDQFVKFASMDRKISVIGLGYVGLPVAVAFGRKSHVIAFDINQKRIDELKKGHDHTREISQKELNLSHLWLTSHPVDLNKADFHIVAVPTPIDKANQPDLRPILAASKTVGEQLKKGDIVVYESTVYPGATEEDCVPVLEKYSGLTCGEDFFVGYSPERINPGDKEHTFTKIRKIVSGQTPEVLDIIAEVYSSVVTAGVYKAASIKVAEAAKVIENTQRDLNIALVNELAKIFNKLDIDTLSVLEAAGTKWNFLPFRPGLVGGHCIGVDPYYLTHRAIKAGYHPEVILAGRRTNDSMGKFIAEQTIKQMIKLGGNVCDAKIGILGLTFKENCPDIRNTKVIDIINELKEYTPNILVHDPHADPEEAKKEYGIDLVNFDEMKDLSALVIAVGHEEFDRLTVEELKQSLNGTKLIIDIKGRLDHHKFTEAGVNVWRM
jgi:UDP-N-acetyl-D-galactosamine dehydrogenase